VAASGEQNLLQLLRHMAPELTPGAFVFCTFETLHLAELAGFAPVAACQEPEGWTLVLPQAQADARALAYDGAFRRITLRVHSSLHAVGLTAAFATALADGGISANVMAGYHHDHIFVPENQADRAMALLRSLAAG
jgi:hypothetical protein